MRQRAHPLRPIPLQYCPHTIFPVGYLEHLQFRRVVSPTSSYGLTNLFSPPLSPVPEFLFPDVPDAELLQMLRTLRLSPDSFIPNLFVPRDIHYLHAHAAPHTFGQEGPSTFGPGREFRQEIDVPLELFWALRNQQRAITTEIAAKQVGDMGLARDV